MLPGVGNERRRREVIELVRTRIGHSGDEAFGLQEVAVHKLDAAAQVLG